MFKKTLIISTLLLALVLSFSGVASAQDSDLEFTFIVKTMTNPYYHEVQKGAEKISDMLGVDLTFTGPSRHGKTTEQVQMVEDALAKNPDALLLIPDNYTALLPALKTANKKNIPVYIVDTDIKEGVVEKETFVGYDDANATSKVAELVAEKINGSGQVAILEGQRGASTAEARLRGYKEKLSEYPDIEIVASQSAGWDREKGLNTSQDILRSNPELDAILASNDEMALGAIQAVRGVGKSDQVIVTGFDAIDPAIKAVKNDQMYCTVNANPDKLGELGVYLAYMNIVWEQPLQEQYMVPITVVTEENL